MIVFVKGEIEHTTDNSVIIDCGGIGYNIFVSPSTLSRLFGQKSVKIYTYHQVKEDGETLFGFLSFEELRLFEKLITVSGLGPKGAQSILSVLKPQEVTLAILSEDADTLTKAQGIGKKIAQRVILELKDKLKSEDAFASAIIGSQEFIPTSGTEKSDAIAALSVLGYSRSDSLKAVMAVAIDNMTTEQIIKAALRKLSSI